MRIRPTLKLYKEHCEEKCKGNSKEKHIKRINSDKTKTQASIQGTFAVKKIWQHREGHLECIQHLLKKGADPNVCDRGGRSPLYWTSFHAHPECARILKEGGAKDLVSSLFIWAAILVFFPPGITERSNCAGCSKDEGSHWNYANVVKGIWNLKHMVHSSFIESNEL